ncbi:hypothetical protein PR048_023707 [Dryococelus australis]|uniref:Uncharacterized protein n=1 Tax=Dryococelus australis TaxID=614101 RepID=A0ABQ9GUU5_9NEOP|nr:hypothetical protein PR048_023707 [Dryococelus australis]
MSHIKSLNRKPVQDTDSQDRELTSGGRPDVRQPQPKPKHLPSESSGIRSKATLPPPRNQTPQQTILQKIVSSDNRIIRTPVLFNNKHCLTLVDTAASHNFVRENFIDRKYLRPIESVIQLATHQHTMQTIGEATVTV